MPHTFDVISKSSFTELFESVNLCLSPNFRSLGHYLFNFVSAPISFSSPSETLITQVLDLLILSYFFPIFFPSLFWVISLSLSSN